MRIVLIVIGSICSLFSFAQDLPLDPAVRTGKLANGFTYYIRANRQPATRVQLYLVNKVGSVLERDDQRGLAHFMEHMSFNGTRHFPKNQLVDYLQRSGVRFGADLNAYTSFDETVYQLPLPTDDLRLLQNGLQIMRDWAGEATLDPKEIEAERGVVLEEKRLGKGAAERMRDKTFPLLLNQSRYASRLPIGTEEVLKTFPRKAILDFYRDWYRPDLQALIVVGDIDVGAMEAQIQKLFSDLRMPPSPKPRIRYEVPLTGKNQFLVVTDPEQPHTVLQILIKQKPAAVRSKKDYERLVKRTLFNQLMGGRLAELSQQPGPPFLQAAAAVEGLPGGLDAFSLSVVAKPGQLAAATQGVWREVQRVKQFGFTASELERAKTAYFAQLASLLKEKDKRSSVSLVQEYVNHFLKAEASPGIETEYALTEAFLPGLSVQDINALATDYIREHDRDIIIMAPEKEKGSLPDLTTVNEWLQAASQGLTAYKDDFKNTELLPVLPAAGTIIREQQLPAIGVTELTLSNGVKVLLKPTAFKNEEIEFNAFSAGGTSLYSDADFESAANAANIVAASGLSTFKPADFPKLLSGKQLRVMPYISERSEGIAGATTPKDLETALQLVHLYFTAPRKDSTVFSNVIEQSGTAIQNRYSDPNNVFADTVAAVLGSYSPRRTGPTIDKLKQIQLEKVFSIYRERFADAGDFTFVFAGNFNVDSIKPLLCTYLGSLPSTGAAESAKDPGIEIPAGKIRRVVHKGTEDKATVRLVISGDYSWSAANNIQLSALGEVLQFRVTERLREKEGGAYSPSARVSYVKLPHNRYAFTVGFGCAPANVERLIRAVQEEIAQLQTSGATATDIAKFVTEQTRQYELQLESNRFWVGYLSGQLELGESLTGVLDYQKLLQQVTPATLKAAAKQYLDTGNFIELVLLPEKAN